MAPSGAFFSGLFVDIIGMQIGRHRCIYNVDGSTLPNSKPLRCQQSQQCQRILTGEIPKKTWCFGRKPVLTVLTVLTPPFFLFLGHFITFLLYLYISSSVDKSDDSVDRVYRGNFS